MIRFNVGDRVEYTGGGSSVLRIGDTGTVVCSPKYRRDTFDESHFFIPVRWDQENDRFHNLDGACDMGHGWFTLRSNLRLIQDDAFETSEELDKFLDSFKAKQAT